MEPTSTLTRSWQDQALPAPLLPAALAEVLTLGLLRQRAETNVAVAAGTALIQLTLAHAGITTTVMLLTGPAQLGGADVLYQTSPEGAELFDRLLSEVLHEPQPVDSTAGSWLRQRTLAVQRLKALSPADTFIQLPDVDAGWHDPVAAPLPAHPTRWLLQALPLLLSLVALDAYIWNAGKGPALWPLLVLPLLGAAAFGGLLFRRLRQWRMSIAQAWLARPARLRPDSTNVATELARAPWALLWWPPALLLLAFVCIVALLVGSTTPTLSVMLGPVALAMLAQLVLSWWRARRYIQETRALVQNLPGGLLPNAEAQGALWQTYSYY